MINERERKSKEEIIAVERGMDTYVKELKGKKEKQFEA